MTRHADGFDEQLEWIRREQFTYYLTIAYMVTDPTDWPAFRRAVYVGLEAALGLVPPLAPTPTRVPRQTPNRNGRRSRCWMRSATASTPPSTGSASPSPCGTAATNSPHSGAATPGHNRLHRPSSAARLAVGAWATLARFLSETYEFRSEPV